MFKKIKKDRNQIDETQLSEEEKKEVGLHINKPLLIVSGVLLLSIIVLTVILVTVLK